MSNKNIFSSIKPTFKVVTSLSFIEIFTILILSLTAFSISLLLSFESPSIFYKQDNIWYGSDIYRVSNNLINSQLYHSRTHVHPIFSIVMYPFIYVLNFIGTSDIQAIYLLIALSGALTTTFLYATLRASGMTILSCFLASSMFMSSATYIHWWSVIETFPFGGTSVASLFLLLGIKNKSRYIWICTSALALGITITNWVAAIIGVFLTFKKKIAIKILGLGFIMVLIVYLFQHFLFLVITPIKIPKLLAHEYVYLVTPKDLSEISQYVLLYGKRAVEFFTAPAVAAETFFVKNHVYAHFFTFKIIGWFALFSWLTILAQGCITIFKLKTIPPLLKAVIGFLLFQLVLHIFYGDSPFLYSAHYTIGLFIIAAFSMHGKQAGLFRYIALVYCITALIHNHTIHTQTIEVLQNL